MLSKLLFKQIHFCLPIWVRENVRNYWQMTQELKSKITSQEHLKISGMEYQQ